MGKLIAYLLAAAIVPVIIGCEAIPSSDDKIPEEQRSQVVESQIEAPEKPVGRYQLRSTTDGRTLRIDTVTGEIALVDQDRLTLIPPDDSLLNLSTWEISEGLPDDFKDNYRFATEWDEGRIRWEISFATFISREIVGETSAGLLIVNDGGNQSLGYFLEGFDSTGFPVITLTLELDPEVNQIPIVMDANGQPKEMGLFRWKGQDACRLAVYRSISSWKLTPYKYWPALDQ